MSQDKLTLPRRRLLAGGALAGASLSLPGALREALAHAPLTVGFIYVGPRATSATTRPMPRVRRR